jgi:serine/threonine protein phosphatase PrpC
MGLRGEDIEGDKGLKRSLRRIGGTYISTILVLALIRACTAYIANLGDSRAYLFRKGKLGESHRRR